MLSTHAAHTTLPVKDIERAKKFYHDKLGLKPERDEPEAVVYKSGNVEFTIFPSQGQSNASFTQMGWEVDNIESEVRDLKARGVVFEEYNYPSLKTVNSIATQGDNKAAWFKDSEGNLLGLIQLHEKQA